MGLSISVNSKEIFPFSSTVKVFENHVWVIVDVFVFVNALTYTFALARVGAMIVNDTIILALTTLSILILDLRNWASNIVIKTDSSKVSTVPASVNEDLTTCSYSFPGLAGGLEGGGSGGGYNGGDVGGVEGSGGEDGGGGVQGGGGENPPGGAGDRGGGG